MSKTSSINSSALNPSVVIIGAGPIGLLLANLLGQAKVQTLIVEKRNVPLESSMAIGITPPSLEILRKLDLDHTFKREGVPVRFAEVHESGRKLGRLDFDGIPSDYPFFLSIPQARTIEILRANLRHFGTVTFKDGVEFAGFTQTSDRVEVALREVGAGTAFRLATSFLVGCDGHRSVVRDAAEISTVEKIYPQRFIMADFVDETGLACEARLFFSASGSVESFPLPGGWRRWIVQTSPSRNGAALQHLISRVYQVTGFNLNRAAARFVSEFGAKRLLANRYYSGRVVVAGDAAHVMSSIGGQGMNTGFADAELLAALLPVLTADPARTSQAFAMYDRIRRQAYIVAARHAEQGMWLGTLRGRFASCFRKIIIRNVLFSAGMQPRLAPHFAMLTIPFRNLNHVPKHLLNLN